MAVEHLVSEDVRRHNLSLILTQLVRSGPSARSELSRATGLTQGSVTALTKALVDVGVIRELEPLVIAKGRPITKLALAADGIAILAVQLSADDVTALLTTLDGDELLRVSRPHGRPMGDAPAVLDVLADVVRVAIDRSRELSRRLASLSVIVLAPVGGDPARVLGDVALGWGEVDVVAELRRRVTGIPSEVIRLSSDTPIAARAELRLFEDGGGDGSDAIYLKADSNIGGAIVVAGTVVEGAHGFGGSLGHLSVVPAGVACECGQHGCLVTVAGIESLLAAEGGRAPWDPGAPSAALESFVGRVERGDPRAVAAWEGALPWIGRALQVLAMATDPGVIIVAGHWARLRASIEAAFVANRPHIARAGDGFGPVVLSSALGADAALRGAVWEARERLILEPLSLAS